MGAIGLFGNLVAASLAGIIATTFIAPSTISQSLQLSCFTISNQFFEILIEMQYFISLCQAVCICDFNACNINLNKKCHDHNQ